MLFSALRSLGSQLIQAIPSVSWRSGGGMDGGYLDYTAENTAKGYALVIKEQKDGARSAVKKSRFKVDPEGTGRPRRFLWHR